LDSNEETHENCEDVISEGEAERSVPLPFPPPQTTTFTFPSHFSAPYHRMVLHEISAPPAWLEVATKLGRSWLTLVDRREEEAERRERRIQQLMLRIERAISTADSKAPTRGRDAHADDSNTQGREARADGSNTQGREAHADDSNTRGREARADNSNAEQAVHDERGSSYSEPGEGCSSPTRAERLRTRGCALESQWDGATFQPRPTRDTTLPLDHLAWDPRSWGDYSEHPYWSVWKEQADRDFQAGLDAFKRKLRVHLEEYRTTFGVDVLSKALEEEAVQRQAEIKRGEKEIQQERGELQQKKDEIEREKKMLRRKKKRFLRLIEADKRRRDQESDARILKEGVRLRAAEWHAEWSQVSQRVNTTKTWVDTAWTVAGGMNQRVRALGGPLTIQLCSLMDLLTRMKPWYEAHEDVQFVHEFLADEDKWTAVWTVLPPLETAIVAVLENGGRDDGFMRANIEKMVLLVRLTIDVVASW
jgi:hypothetical protein